VSRVRRAGAVAAGGIVLVLVGAAEVGAAHREPRMRDVVLDSRLVVRGRVSNVYRMEGFEVAQIDVTRPFVRPAPPSRIYAIAAADRCCDISDFDVGEAGLYFLQRPRFLPCEHRLVAVTPRLAERLALHGYHPVYQLTHRGRGRLPVETVDGVEHYATWAAMDLTGTRRSVPSAPSRRFGRVCLRGAEMDAYVKSLLRKARRFASHP
jgi:hypothetical protein